MHKKSLLARATALFLLCAIAPAMLYAAVATPNASVSNASLRGVAPVSIMGNWVNVCTDLATADNAGSTVLNPAGITRAAQGKLQMLGAGTTVQWRIRYTTGTTITAGTIQPFGFDANGIPDKLVDSTGSNALAFLSVAASDAQDGTYSYTDSQEVDANGASSVLGAVKVLATGTGAATAVLQARVK